MTWESSTGQSLGRLDLCPSSLGDSGFAILIAQQAPSEVDSWKEGMAASTRALLLVRGLCGTCTHSPQALITSVSVLCVVCAFNTSGEGRYLIKLFRCEDTLV